MSIENFRRDYKVRELAETTLLSDPVEMFRVWFREAEEQRPAEWFEVNAMALATSSASGHVSVRTILLKGFDADGFAFYTNYDSMKGNQLSENPRAATCLHWPYLERQVRVEGIVRRVPREQSEVYFHSRPRGSQIGAVVSRQSAVIASREALEQAAAEIGQRYSGQQIPLPDNWGGYQIVPVRIEFWQGRQDRLHDRIMYVRDDQNSEWTRQRLAP